MDSGVGAMAICRRKSGVEDNREDFLTQAILRRQRQKDCDRNRIARDDREDTYLSRARA
jgi:hypothetical protein